MPELTVRKIVEIHDEIINKYGGTRGILTDVFRQAALILYRIASQHPFFDGNKRTALVTAEKVLYDEGYYIHAEPEAKVALMQKIAEYKCSVKTIEKWIRERAGELHPG